LISNPKKQHVVTSETEHSSVLNYCRELAKRGLEITFLPVTRDGLLDLQKLENAIRADTAIVSLMWANNETGVIAPVQEIAEICARRGVAFHCDAVQAVGKIHIDFHRVPIQFLSLSGHKLGAPKGVGALIIKDGIPFHPLLVGGKQESGRRAGTESVPLIVGLGAACQIASARVSEWEAIAVLRNRLEKELLSSLRGIYRNGAACFRLPNTLSIGIPGIDNDALVTYCDRNDVCISSGSACLEDAITPSHVILAMTGSYERATEVVRVSLGLDTQLEAILELPRLFREFVELSDS
jgi:cysteine desulfurase